MKKIVTIIGARPQFVKAAVVSRAIAKHNQQVRDDNLRLREIIVHTGQHYDNNMSTVFFDEMQVPKPDYNLDIHSLSHGAMTGQMLEKLESLLLEEKPEIVLVYGDTNTTLAGSLAATKLHIPIAHVEAGLRSFNRLMPEEINRVLTDNVANILFCPTLTAVKNLENEGIGKVEDRHRRNAAPVNHSDVGTFSPMKEGVFESKPMVSLVGDVMLDAANYYRKFARKPAFDLPDVFIVATIHRAENTDNPGRLKSIFASFEIISEEIPIIIPLHPRTQKILKSNGLAFSLKQLQIVEPVGYLNMIHMLDRCEAVMTDSGGLQKEAYFFKKPCITLREETEWIELVEYGYNCLAGSDKGSICAAYSDMMNRALDFKLKLYGDGNAGEKIVKILVNYGSCM